MSNQEGNKKLYNKWNLKKIHMQNGEIGRLPYTICKTPTPDGLRIEI